MGEWADRPRGINRQAKGITGSSVGWVPAAARPSERAMCTERVDLPPRSPSEGGVPKRSSLARTRRQNPTIERYRLGVSLNPLAGRVEFPHLVRLDGPRRTSP